MKMNTIMRNMQHVDISTCARIACTSSLREAYGFTEEAWQERLKKALTLDENLLFVAEHQQEIAGFAWAHPHGAFLAAPYLRFIAVGEGMRGLGIGSLLLDEYEKRTASVGKDFFLLVSDFNSSAIRFYEQHGYGQVGILPDFSVHGIGEIIMVKKHTHQGI
jgi:ribosomal protein S18 acetylase RimI-like enzyme